MTDRIKKLLEQLNLSPSEFADKIGVQRSSVSHVLSGRNKPSIDFLEKILIVFPDIDSTWLITGRSVQQKNQANDEFDFGNEEIQGNMAQFVPEEHKKTPAPAIEEPVDHIIIVYKNNTFRLITPAK